MNNYVHEFTYMNKDDIEENMLYDKEKMGDYFHFAYKDVIESIKNNGYNPAFPILITKRNGDYVVVDGNIRLRALKHGGFYEEMVPCLIVSKENNEELTEQEFYEETVRANSCWMDLNTPYGFSKTKAIIEFHFKNINKNGSFIDSAISVIGQKTLERHYKGRELTQKSIAEHFPKPKNGEFYDLEKFKAFISSDIVSFNRHDLSYALEVAYHFGIEDYFIPHDFPEKEIEDFCMNHAEYFSEKTLGVIPYKRQVRVSNGVIDILGKKDERDIVIEIKAIKANHRVVGQIMKYMNKLDDQAIIIAPSFSGGFFEAKKHLPNVKYFVFNSNNLDDPLIELYNLDSWFRSREKLLSNVL